MKRRNIVFAVIFIVVGLAFLLSAIGAYSLNWGNMWPFILIVLSIVFHAMAIATKDPGTLVPGGILLVVGLQFLLSMTLKVYGMGDLWPLFIFAPALGLYELYIFGTRDRGLLIPVGILCCVSAAFIFTVTKNYVMEIIISVIIIIFGLSIVFAPPKDEKKDEDKKEA